ncbi:MAG TPA: hypothetical protein VKZ79_02210 [Alphaproteobacteria bacterium]|nr:hypothetical protein [Alphaproteobacteria bacterium]
MLKETKTKMLVQVWDVLARAIKRDLRSLHITRDAYLNALLKREIEELAQEVEFETPSDALRHINKRLRGLNRERMTIAVDRDVAERIRQILEERNISRDAFVNRILFFLVAKPAHLKRFGFEYERQQEVEVKPLDDAWTFLHDPFANIRMSNDNAFYTLLISDEPPAQNWPNLFGLNCAINAESWSLISTPLDSLLGELGLGELAT